MKKIISIIILAILCISLSGCDFLQISQDKSENVEEEIYNLAQENGYEGSYIKWKDAIQKEKILLFEEKGFLKWKETNKKESYEIINLNMLIGQPGESVELDVQNGYLVWKEIDSSKWNKLYKVYTLEEIETPEDPGTQPEDPGTQPEDPGTQPENPGTQPEDPGTHPEDPGTQPEDPGTQPEDPGTQPENPGEVEEKYIVVFNSNGGTNVIKQEVLEKNKISEPEQPTREGYIFNGWYYNNQKWDFDNDLVTEDMVLVAQWNLIEPVIVCYTNVSKMVVNSTIQLDFEIVNLEDTKGFIYYTSDTTIATIDQSGLLTARSSGKVDVFAVSVLNTNVVYTLTVDVYNEANIIGLDNIDLNETAELGLECDGNYISNDQIVWVSSDENIAKIEEGYITGIQCGTVSIYAYFGDVILASAEVELTENMTIDLGGYTIKIAQAEHALQDYDPFLASYIGADKEYRQQAIIEIEEKYNCKINIVAYPENAEWGPSRWNYIMDSYLYDEVEYDFYTVPERQIPLFAKSGALLDLTEYYNLYGNNMMLPSSYTSGSYNNKLYSLKNNKSNIYNVMYYNINLFETLKLIDPTLKEPAQLFLDGEWTYDNFMIYCKKVQNAMAFGFGTEGDAGSYDQKYYAVSGWDAYWWVGLTGTNGKPIVDIGNLTVDLDSTEKEDAANVVRYLYSSGVADPRQSVDQGVSSWNEGRALFNTGDLWFVRSDNRWSEDLWGGDTRYGYVPWPRSNNTSFEDYQVALTDGVTWVMAAGRDYSGYGDECNSENIYRVVAEYLQLAKEKYENSNEYNYEEIVNQEAIKYTDSEASRKAYVYIQKLIDEGKCYYDPLCTSDNPIVSLYALSFDGTTVKSAINMYVKNNVSDWKEAIYNLEPVLKDYLNETYLSEYELPYYTVSFDIGIENKVEPLIYDFKSITSYQEIIDYANSLSITRENYKLVGWSLDKENIIDPSEYDPFMIRENITLIAVWEFVYNDKIDNPSNASEIVINELAETMNNSGFFDAISYFPFGKSDRLNEQGQISNVLPVPKKISDVTTEALFEYQNVDIIWSCSEEGLFDENYKLLKQYLRFHRVFITYSITIDGNTATLETPVNVGIAEKENTIYIGGNFCYQQKGTGDVAGDVLCQLSKFDSPVGTVSNSGKTWGYSYGHGEFNGYTWYIDQENNKGILTRYQYFAAVQGFITLDEQYNIDLSNPFNPVITLNEELNANIGITYGGNWSNIYHNITDHEVRIPLSPYIGGISPWVDESGEQVYWTTHPNNKSNIIDRENAFGMDGYRVGFVTDANGKVVFGNGESVIQAIEHKADGQMTEEDFWITIPAGGYAYGAKTQQNNASIVGKFCVQGIKLNISFFDPYFSSPDGSSEGLNIFIHE